MRVFFFLLLTVTVFSTPFFIGVLAFVIYAFAFRAYEGILLGACVDLLFSHTTIAEPPLYALSFGCAVIIIELVKMRLSFYNDYHGSV